MPLKEGTALWAKRNSSVERNARLVKPSPYTITTLLGVQLQKLSAVPTPGCKLAVPVPFWGASQRAW